MDMVFPAERTHFFQAPHKIGAAISGPRIADKTFTDTRLFLKSAGGHPKGFPQARQPLFAVPALRENSKVLAG